MLHLTVKNPMDFLTGSRVYLGYCQMPEKMKAIDVCTQDNAAHHRRLSHRVTQRNHGNTNITTDLGLHTSENISHICGSF